MINLTAAEIANFVYVAPKPADGMQVYTAMVRGGSLNVRMVQYFETTEERDAYLATLPKSWRLRAAGPTQISTSFNFAADERTGDVNEAAAKRLRAIAKKLPLTHRVDRLVNAQPNVEEVLAMIDRPIKVAV